MQLRHCSLFLVAQVWSRCPTFCGEHCKLGSLKVSKVKSGRFKLNPGLKPKLTATKSWVLNWLNGVPPCFRPWAISLHPPRDRSTKTWVRLLRSCAHALHSAPRSTSKALSAVSKFSLEAAFCWGFNQADAIMLWMTANRTGKAIAFPAKSCIKCSDGWYSGSQSSK